MGQAIDDHDLVLRLGRHLTFQQEADLGARTTVRFTDHNHMRLREDVRHPPPLPPHSRPASPSAGCRRRVTVRGPLCGGWEPTRVRPLVECAPGLETCESMAGAEHATVDISWSISDVSAHSTSVAKILTWGGKKKVLCGTPRPKETWY